MKNFEVCCGAEPNGHYTVSNKANDVIFRSVEPVKCRNFNVALEVSIEGSQTHL